MAINYTTQPIVTDNLVLYYDAGNINSCLGNPPLADPMNSPTNWNDLTHNVGITTFLNTGFTNAPAKTFTVWLSARYNVSWDHYTIDYNSFGSGPSADRNGGLGNSNDPDININVGDTLILNTEVAATLNNAAGPTWIKTATGTGSGNAVDNPTATNNGTSSTNISWTPSEAGTYYYQNGTRVNMVGQIIVTDNSDVGHSIIFNGTDSKGIFNAASTFGFGTGQFTFEMWVDTYHDGAWAWYFTSKTSPGGTTRVMIGVSGATEKFAFGFQDLADNPTFPVNSWSGWKHIVTSREGTGANQFKLYINGELIGSVTNDTDYASDGTAGYLGSWEDTEHIKAKLGCFKVYKGKALTAAEVKQNFDANRGRFGL